MQVLLCHKQIYVLIIFSPEASANVHGEVDLGVQGSYVCNVSPPDKRRL